MVAFIKGYETYCPIPTDDGWGNMTIGYGHVITERETYTQLTELEATQLLMEDLSISEQYVINYSKELGAVWDQQQFDAFVDIAFNGGGQMELAMNDIFVNKMDPREAFTYGESYYGLFCRRNDEANIFLEGRYERTYPEWNY